MNTDKLKVYRILDAAIGTGEFDVTAADAMLTGADLVCGEDFAWGDTEDECESKTFELYQYVSDYIGEHHAGLKAHGKRLHDAMAAFDAEFLTK